MGVCFKIHYWPGLTCAWFIITFIITYLVSVYDGNVYAVFPYISDTGALPPESCIFSQLVNIGCVLLAITMYLQYRIIDLLIKHQKLKLKSSWNSTAIVIGFIACLGLSIVSNFQETAVGGMHFLGAMMALGVGSIYFYIQTWISFSYEKAAHLIGSKTLYLRAFLAFWLLPLFITNVICATLSVRQFTGKSIVWWTEEDGGFELRLAGSFTEWILVIFVFIYMLTYTKEFTYLEYKSMDISIKQVLVEPRKLELV